MIPNVTRGDRMGGLLSYLVGEGKVNEHTDPHLVAGDPALMTWHDDAELGRADALAIAAHLDRPRKAFGVEVKGGHVWHCSLSLRAAEGLKTDEQWAAIAQAFIERMGFDDGVKAPVRWAAIRHGVSAGGNDHIHLAVNLVREDGTKASTHHDYARAQRVSRELEAEFGLERLNPERAGRTAYRRAELEIAARTAAQKDFEQRRAQGVESRRWEELPARERRALTAAKQGVEPQRVRLHRVVRAASTAAADEAEFVRRMRRAGLLVRPRFASGRQDVVTGFAVAERPPAGERPVFYGGGMLAKDLTLPRLRQQWPDTPQAASAAAAEWNAGRRNQRPVAPGREAFEPDPQLWQAAARDLQQMRERLRAVPADDVDTWARVARETSGALAAWSVRAEAEPGPLAAAADELARSAQTRTQQPPASAGPLSLAGTAMLLAAASRGDARVAQAVVLRQMLNLMKAVADAHVAAGEARRAQGIERAVREQLAQVVADLPAPQPVAVGAAPGTSGGPDKGPGADPESVADRAVRTARQGQEPLREAPPIPTPLTPHRPAQKTSGSDRRPDIER